MAICKGCGREIVLKSIYPANMYAQTEGYCFFQCMLQDVSYSELLKRLAKWTKEHTDDLN